MSEDMMKAAFSGLIAVLIWCILGGLIWTSYKEVMAKQQMVAACVQLGNPVADCKELGK